jgi:aminopeptidase N
VPSSPPDALVHPLYLSPRRGLDVNPFEPPATRRGETLATVRRPVRDRAFHVEHLRLDLEVDLERGRLAGTATLVVRPVAAGLREIDLDASEMRIGAVTLAAGRNGSGRAGRRLRAHHDGERLTVRLDRAYGHEETLALRIAYRARPRRGFWFVRPDQAYPKRLAQGWTQSQAEDAHAWFPVHDHPNDKFTSEIVVTAPRGLRTVANGRLVSRRPSRDGAGTTWHWTQERPHPAYLMSLVVAPFVETRGRAGRVPLRFYAFPGQGRAARRLYGRTADMMRTFERLFGAYPWREYAQTVVTEFTWGGMENTGSTTLTEKALLDDRAALDVSYEGLVSHELAHQWWGDLVTCRGWHHNWLNESWATFSENLYDAKANGEASAQWDRIQKTTSYVAQDRGQYRRPIVFDRYTIPMDLFDRHAYEKGSLVLAMLRDELGDEVFFRGARRYLATHAFGFADTHDFRRALEEESGRDLTWFFEQWVFAAGHPELEVRWRPEVRGGRATGRAVVRIRQRQSTREDGPATTPLFRLDLDVVVHGGPGGRRSRTHRVTVSRRDETLVLEGPGGAPVRIAVDPDFRVLKRLELVQDAAAWRHALARDRSPAERMRAARTLAGRRGASADRATARALEAALAGDKSAPVRMAAAIALGERAHGRPAVAARTARVLASALSRDPDPHARRGAAFALGLCGRAGEEALWAAATGPARTGERSYLVRATALKALAQVRSPRTLAACRAAMDHRGWRDLVPMAALDALAMAKPPQAFDLAYTHVRYGETQEVREAAVRLLVALARDPKARRARREQARHVVPTLEALMGDPSVFTQLAAAQAAAKLGDRALMPALRRLVREEVWDHLVHTAEKSLQALSKTAPGRKARAARTPPAKAEKR